MRSSGSGKTPGSGRKKGSLSKRTVAAMEIADRLKCDPFEVLIHFAKGDWKALGYDSEVYHLEKPDGSIKMGFVITPEMRITAAKDACRYLYPTKAAVTVSSEDKGFALVIKDYTK